MAARIDIILLSILMEKPAHGYEVEQAINERHIRKWAGIGTSSIYSGLDRLEKKGLAKSVLDTSQGLPARRVFTITEQGRVVLREGARELLRKGEYIYLDFNVGMAAFPYLEKEEILALTKERRQELAQIMADAEENRPHPDMPAPEHARWVWKHEYDLLQAEIAWLDEFIGYLEREASYEQAPS